MSALNIYVRQDLGMRKGKMAAQSAHAAMKLCLESMVYENDQLVLKHEDKFQAFLKEPVVNIIMAKDEAEFDASPVADIPHSVIVDSGRTEFNGVPTKTCMAQGVFTDPLPYDMYVKKSFGADIRAKQLFVFSKEKPLPKDRAAKLAVILCLELLYDQLELNSKGERCIDFTQMSPLTQWLSGGFAKIGVSTKTDAELYELKGILEEQGFQLKARNMEGSLCLAVSPQYPEEINPFTGHLALI